MIGLMPYHLWFEEKFSTSYFIMNFPQSCYHSTVSRQPTRMLHKQPGQMDKLLLDIQEIFIQCSSHLSAFYITVCVQIK